MKKNLEKKLVLKKLTMASLNAEQLKTFRGGLAYEDTIAPCYADPSVGYYCGGGTFGCDPVTTVTSSGDGDPRPEPSDNTH